jgi:phage protein D
MCKHQRHNGGDSLNSFVGVLAKQFGLHATLKKGRLISLERQRGKSIIGLGIIVMDVHGTKARKSERYL